MNSKYLGEILISEDTHLPNINSKILELVNHTNILKNDVRNVIENSSVEFKPLLKENGRLKLKADKLLNEMSSLQEKIEGEIKQELSCCANELQNLSSSLMEINMFLEILKRLVEINTILKKAREKIDKKQFYECSKLVTDVQDLIKNNRENLKEIEMFKILSQEVILTYEQLMHQISETWMKHVNIEIQKEIDQNTSLITVFINIEFSNEISQILKASSVLKTNSIEKKFGQVLLNNVFNEIITKKSKINVKLNNAALLTVEIFKNDKKPNYLEIFENLKNVINFLKTHLRIEVQDGILFLSNVGPHIANELAESLIKNCLSETIPTSSEDLEKYKSVISDAEAFEKSLQEISFLPQNSSSLLDYAKNVNVLFANKFCQTYLEKARVIMKKDLHNIVKSVEIVSNVNVLPMTHQNLLREKMNIQEEIFSFPNCQISKSAEELIHLVQSMMKEIQKSMDLCAVRLFYTVRNIFEMYSAIVPFHHKKFLENLPHQVAIFHNNCLHFAHYLIHLTTDYYNKIPSILKDHFSILLEEAVILRSLAAETLETTVTNQRNLLIYILRDSGFATLNENPNLDPNSEKSIRQCVRQLQILQTVWLNVLPYNVYNRAIGFLLDSIIEELILLIISVEDISLRTASDLESCFNIILDKCPGLFPEAKEIHRHSKKWQKFKEFVLILKGTLKDIDDRWANGMGPLAIEFTAEQVKHLIRALFQNSEKRAALLARIR